MIGIAGILFVAPPCVCVCERECTQETGVRGHSGKSLTGAKI